MASVNGTAGKVLSPSKLAHIVLQTNNFEAMRDFYKVFLGATASFENDSLSFITYDEEHHRVAIVKLPGLKDKDFQSSGLFHYAFTFDTLQDLCTAYKQRKAIGIEPRWCVNHGPTTSMYYRDPDGNQIETQVDNMGNDECTAMMASAEFEKNPIGVDFDPEDLCRRVECGESEESIKKRPDVGYRSAEDMGPILANMYAAAKA